MFADLRVALYAELQEQPPRLVSEPTLPLAAEACCEQFLGVDINGDESFGMRAK